MDFPGFPDDSTQSPTDPCGTKLRPTAPSKWRFLSISEGRAGFPRIPLRHRPGRVADPRIAEIFLDILHILHNRPQIPDVRNCAPPRQVSGEIAESRLIGWGYRRISPLRRRTGRAADPRTSEIFQDFLKILHNRPLIHEVRNCAQSHQVSGDFSVSLSTWGDFDEDRPFAAQPAGRWVRKQRGFFWIF